MSSPLDCTLLEKSIRNGCRTIVCRGTGQDAASTSVFELLVDLALTEDIDLETSLVGYCLQGDGEDNAGSGGGSGGSGRTKALAELASSLGGKRILDFANIPVRLTPSGAIEASCLQERETLQHDMQQHGVSIGLDLQTSALSGLSAEQAEALLGSLGSLPSALPVTVATNALTAPLAQRIHAALRRACHGDQERRLVLSTEIFKVSASPRPALLIPYPTTIAGKTTMDQAVDDLKHATDRCVQLEKHFLDKMRAEMPEVPVTDVCWGHVLLQTQHSIQSPEEWHYLLAHQIMPKLDKSSGLLRSKSKAAAEWAALHAGMARYMFSCFSTVQECRRTAVCSELVLRCNAHLDAAAAGPASLRLDGIGHIPRFVAQLVSALGDDAPAATTCLSGCEVPASLAAPITTTPPTPPPSPAARFAPSLALGMLAQVLGPAAAEFY